MTKSPVAKNETLASFQKSIKYLKEITAGYHAGSVSKEQLRIFIKLLQAICERGRLQVRAVILSKQSKVAADSLIKTDFFDEETLVFFSDKDNLKELRTTVKELSEGLKDAKALLKGEIQG